MTTPPTPLPLFTPLTDCAVVVTGASRGIGRGIAAAFAAAGARVLVTARGEESLVTTAQELRDAGGQVEHAVVDVSRGEDCERLAELAVERIGGVDVLCTNAGIFPEKPLAAMTEADVDHVLATNVKGTILPVTACVPALTASGRGRVIVTSSITGPITGYPGWAHYGASKAAQLGFVRTAAVELGRAAITVNAVLPGNILTEGLVSMGEDYLTRMASSIPLGRLGSVADIANAALFLATIEAGYITGASLVIDGGQVLPESLDAVAGSGVEG